MKPITPARKTVLRAECAICLLRRRAEARFIIILDTVAWYYFCEAEYLLIYHGQPPNFTTCVAIYFCFNFGGDVNAFTGLHPDEFRSCLADFFHRPASDLDKAWKAVEARIEESKRVANKLAKMHILLRNLFEDIPCPISDRVTEDPISKSWLQIHADP